MKSEGVLKHFLVVFVLALVLYAVFYTGIEHRRNVKGPWLVSFTKTADGLPSIRISQPTLAISNVCVCFAGQSASSINGATVIDFRQPRPVPYEVPYGKCLFMDTTFLPGTLTFQLFGHEIELLPRTLIIDHEEHAWRSNETIELKK